MEWAHWCGVDTRASQGAGLSASSCLLRGIRVQLVPIRPTPQPTERSWSERPPSISPQPHPPQLTLLRPLQEPAVPLPDLPAAVARDPSCRGLKPHTLLPGSSGGDVTSPKWSHWAETEVPALRENPLLACSCWVFWEAIGEGPSGQMAHGRFQPMIAPPPPDSACSPESQEPPVPMALAPTHPCLNCSSCLADALLLPRATAHPPGLITWLSPVLCCGQVCLLPHRVPAQAQGWHRGSKEAVWAQGCYGRVQRQAGGLGAMLHLKALCIFSGGTGWSPVSGTVGGWL